MYYFMKNMTDSRCEHYWTPNGAYFCIHCGVDIDTIHVKINEFANKEY